MIITCEECRTSFNLDEKLLKPTGSKVRCSKCGKVFMAVPPHLETAAPAEVEPVAPVAPQTPAQDAVEEKAAGIGAAAAEVTDDIDLGLDLDAGEAEESELPVDDLDLSELGLDAEAEPEPGADVSETDLAAADAELDAELDFSDLDLGDEEAEEAEPVVEESGTVETEDEGELDLSDLDVDLDTEDEIAATEAETPDDDELDLGDLDLGVDFEEEPASSEPASPEAEDELDLGDLDIGAEFEEESAALEPAGPEAEDELDLGDLDLGADFEEEAAALEPAAPEADDGLDIDDLDLDLDSEGGASEVVEEAHAEDELDLGDLDLDALEGGVAPTDELEDVALDDAADEAPGTAEDGLDLDDLDLDGLGEEPATEEALDDLDLDLGADDDITPAAGTTSQEETSSGKLDISELEAVFDADDDETDADSEEKEEYDLEFDMEMLDDDDSSVAEDVSLSDSADDLDLSDVETMLEGSDDQPAPPAEGEMAGGEEISEGELNLELEEMEPEAVGAGLVSETAELDHLPEAGAEDDGAPASFAETMDMETLEKESMALEDGVPEAEAEQAIAAVKPKAKRGLGRPVKFLLILFLLLAVIGGGLYSAVTFMGIQIPFVSDFLNPQPDNVNRIEIMQATVRSKFVENNKTGKLFVITGRVINGYKEPHNFISVTGRLYGKGKKLIASQTVFAGNMLMAMEQATLDLPSLKKRLRNRVGQKKSNMNVKPGGGLPFMIIFANLPAQLEEFTVEPGSSVAAQ